MHLKAYEEHLNKLEAEAIMEKLSNSNLDELDKYILKNF